MYIKILLLLVSFNLIAQTKVKEKFSNKEITSFLIIYKHTLDFPFDMVSAMKKSAKEIQITEERLSEILQNQFAGNTIQLSDMEIKEMQKLQSLMNIEKQKYEVDVNKFIAAHNLSQEKYILIKKQYDTNIKFQKRANQMFANNTTKTKNQL